MDYLMDDLTQLLREVVTGPIRTIFSINGTIITDIKHILRSELYVCACNNENFKNIQYNINESRSRNMIPRVITNLEFVFPHVIVLIRNGSRPRLMSQLLLNKHNSLSFNHVMRVITDVIKLRPGYIRKIYTLQAKPVKTLADFFSSDDVFVVFGTERVQINDDFILDNKEIVSLKALSKRLRNVGWLYSLEQLTSTNTEKAVEYQPTTNLISPNVMPSICNENYICNDLVGQGGFGFVLKMIDSNTQEPYALKVVEIRSKNSVELREIDILKKLSHRHIVHLLNAYKKKSKLFLMMEYVSGTDLSDVLEMKTNLTEAETKLTINQIILGLRYIHHKKVIHRDIKPNNILVELSHGSEKIKSIKITDFGAAIQTDEPVFDIIGTPQFMAPEIIKRIGYGKKVDVFSSGIVMYILLFGKYPFGLMADDKNYKKLFASIILGKYSIPNSKKYVISNDAKDFMAKLLSIDLLKRPSCNRLLRHCWLNPEEGSSD
ncbi:serine/threonine-protein kinase DCLK1-like [Teleopsis dalmanni]|nr:serine/threonine-protein kinase DCLK1-like [Teleopsis dalmanni]